MMARFSLLLFILGLSSFGFGNARTRAFKESSNYCPPDAEGFFPVGYGCTRDYYYCHNGVAYDEQCPCSDAADPTCPVYDHNHQLCVPPEICIQSPTTLLIPTTAGTTTLRPFTCPKDGFFPVPQSCTSSYYVCVEGVALLQSCPVGSVFDPVTYSCKVIEEASCAKPVECPPTHNGVYPYPGACTSLYVYCTDGVGIAQYCPANTVFLPDSLTCAPVGEEPPCTPGGPYTALPTTQSTTTSSTTTESTTTTTTTQSTTSTTQSTTTTTTTAPNTTITTTQPPTTTTTTQPTTTTQSTTTTTTPTTTTTTPTTTTTTPTTTTTTPTTTTTTPTTTTTQPTTTTTTGTTTKDPFYFECPTPTGKFPYEGNCTLYWNCVNNVATLTQCPSDTGFNPATGNCELAFLIPNCNAKTFYQTYNAVNKEFVCPAKVGHFAIQLQKCALSYISCEMGIPFNKYCPDGEVFDPLEIKCVPSQISSCVVKRAKLAKIYG